MDIIDENELLILKENMFGELEWNRVNSVNLGSYKEPNEKIKQIKIQTRRYFKP